MNLLLKRKIPIFNRVLLCFDMDQTILNRDTDLIVRENLLTLSQLQHAEKFKFKNWAESMQYSIDSIKSNGYGIEDIKKLVQSVDLNPGMKELFDFIKTNKTFLETSIITGANTIFCEWVMERHNLDKIIDSHFSLNVQRDDQLDKLFIYPLNQKDCMHSCDEAICKGKVLSHHFLKRPFLFKAYAGDGNNDFCPVTHFTQGDVLYARKDYGLYQTLFEKQKIHDLKCDVVVWETGHEIAEDLKSRMENAYNNI